MSNFITPPLNENPEDDLSYDPIAQAAIARKRQKLADAAAVKAEIDKKAADEEAAKNAAADQRLTDSYTTQLNTLAPSEYQIHPQLKEYITNLKEGKAREASQERQQNAMYNAFDTIGKARANEWGTKSVDIGDIGDTAQQANATAEAAANTIQAKDLTGHIDMRRQIAEALARKRDTTGSTEKPYFRGTGAITKDTHLPINMVGYDQSGQAMYESMDGQPVSPDNILTKDILAQDVKQKENLSKVLSNPQGIATAVQDLEKELGFALEDTDIPSGKDVVKVGGKEVDLPGVNTRIFGRMAGIPFTDNFNKAKDLDAKIGSIFNSTLHLRSGSAVTDAEFKRLRDEFAQGKLNTEAAMVKALRDFKINLSKTMKNKEAGYKPEVVQEYKDTGGLTSDTFLGKQAQQSPQPSTQAQIKEVERVTPNGRKAIYNADTKEFIRYVN